MEAFEDWLTDKIGNAEGEAKESHKAAMNSYGAGYHAGYLAALKLIAEKMTPEIAGCLVQ